MTTPITRRTFLAASTGAFTALSAGRVWGANDAARLGIIGTGDRGKYLMGTVKKVADSVGGIRWVALADIWDARREEGKAAAGTPVEGYSDYRELLDRADIDGVIIATPDHHHATMTIDACRAGKDVYVEKPMTSHPMQGRDVLNAVGDRIVQVGMQQRSMKHFIEAKQRFFDSGLIGQVHLVRTVWNGNGGYLTKPPPGSETKPEGLDWEAWLGPLPRIPWDPKRYFNRFAYWDVSTGGQTGGLFVHMIDVAHWFLDNHRPLAAVAGGGIYQYNDGRDTPDTVNLILEYPAGLNVTFEATLTDRIRENLEDMVFMGAGGRLRIFRWGYDFLPARENESVGRITGNWSTDLDHTRNWLECLRTRKTPNADVRAGHYSSMACHIGNIAYREKARVTWNDEWDIS